MKKMIYQQELQTTITLLTKIYNSIILKHKKINNHPQQQQQPNKITTIDDNNNTNNNQQHTITIITTIIIREYKQPRDQYGRVEINNLGVTMIS
jgi:hypothetical protein